ncbi:MAG: DnaJ-domain-containing protein [Benniella sp.]|nr:MAG: DnaJ-domain-containing protein [Benniella sp.]
MATPPIIESRKPLYLTAECISCNTPVEFLIPKSTGEVFIQCYACRQVLSIDLNLPQKGPSASTSTPKSSSNTSNKRDTLSKPKRGVGSDASPLETELYDALGVPVDATAAQIKKEYRALALKYHPDKNPDPDSHAKFQKISEAYQILSDPKLRTDYNMYGLNKDVSPEGGFVNPEAFFKSQFGGDRFVDIIGEISIGRDMRDALNETDGDAVDLTPEEKARREASVNEVKDKARDEARQQRVDKLVKNLIHKLSIYADGPCDATATKAFEDQIRLEAEDLKAESYGVELLHAIGFTYTLKAKQFLGKNEMLGLGSWFHGVREKGHILSETVSTLRAAMDLQQSFSQLQEAENGQLDEAAKKNLEEAAASKGLRALWKGSKLEVEGVLRDVCDKVLGDTSVAKTTQLKRASALKIIGAVYESVKADPTTTP